MGVDLKGLAVESMNIIAAPGGAGSVGTRPSVEVPKLVMVPRAWVPYFLVPQLPWIDLDTF